MQNQTPSSEAKPCLNIAAAILTGHLLVNLPVLIIMCGFVYAGIYHIKDNLWPVFFLLGFVFAWMWWSFMVPRWRRWALKQGAPEEKLQKWAVATGLTWTKGSIFERTEFKLKDEDKS
jgi:hypothetical protein